jgi:hypothetical protein
VCKRTITGQWKNYVLWVQGWTKTKYKNVMFQLKTNVMILAHNWKQVLAGCLKWGVKNLNSQSKKAFKNKAHIK